MVTVGGFGIGLLYDLFRLSAYVEEANLTAATRITHSIYANKKRRAGMLQVVVNARTYNKQCKLVFQRVIYPR